MFGIGMVAMATAIFTIYYITAHKDYPHSIAAVDNGEDGKLIIPQRQ